MSSSLLDPKSHSMIEEPSRPDTDPSSDDGRSDAGRRVKTGVTIGELAKGAGVGVETVRYYQRRGLFPEPERRPRSTREYGPEALALLRFIRRARALGFTIREVERLVGLREKPEDAPELAELVNRKVTELEAKMEEMKQVIGTLRDIASRCEAAPARDRFRVFDVES